MPFDESLAARIRDVLARKKNIEERKMFGWIEVLDRAGHEVREDIAGEVKKSKETLIDRS